jgi:molybdate transport system substrate-binding protein
MRWAIALCLALVAPSSRAAEIALVAPGGIRAALERLVPAFEKASGNHVKATFGSGGGTKAQVVKGDPFDAPIVQPPLDEVVASGNVIAATRTPLAKVWVGFAAKKGAPRPDISTPEAVTKLLLGARAIAYPNAASGAAAGASFDATLKKLGIFDEVQAKRKLTRGGVETMAALAHDDVDVALTFISEIVTEPGVEVVGPVPAAISEPTRFVGFVSAKSKEPDAAKALLAYLSSKEAAEVYKARGMEAGE